MQSAEIGADRIALGVLAVIAVIAALTFRDYGLGWDDYTQSEYGDLLLSLYNSGFSDKRVFEFVNLYKYGGSFDLAAALAAKISPFDLFETRRLIGAIVGLIGLALTWRLARRVGGPIAGAIALMLLACCLFYYGHMFMNSKDATFAVAMIALLYALVCVFEAYSDVTPRMVAILGVTVGVAMGTRILAFVAGLYALFALILLVLADNRREHRTARLMRAGIFLWRLLPALLIGYLVMGLLWPWSILDPLNPIYAATYFSEFFEKPWRELYEGQLIAVPDMPFSYAPHFFLIKLPEIMLVLGLAGATGAIVAIFRRNVVPTRRAVLLLILLAAFAPIAIAMVTHPAFYNGVRQFDFIVPPFAILGGLAGAALLKSASRHGASAVATVLAVYVAALVLPLTDMVRLHPYQYAAFNRIAGGVRGAQGNYMIDYWGLSFKQASDALRAYIAQRNEHPPRALRFVVAICGPQRGAQVALGREFTTTAESKGADFAMMLGEFYCRRLDAPLVASVEREGVTFARVYDIRGRAIGNLLTTPPP